MEKRKPSSSRRSALGGAVLAVRQSLSVFPDKRTFSASVGTADTLDSFNASLRMDDLYEARGLLQRSLAIDPNYARSYAAMAHTHVAVIFPRRNGQG
jgi:Tfp pilus assembly protein PilF